MVKWQSFFFVLIAFTAARAQQIPDDSIRVLEPVIIQAYSAGRPIEEVSASVAHLNTFDLHRFNNTNILPAVNAIPGVRMEERSPGSYRFSIRGSLLRSPFGVRNVKAYWNGLPLTDGGGNTYLNLLDFGSIGSMELIKGPAGSLYGAGTGGVILLNSPLVTQDQWEFAAMAGSFGQGRVQLAQQFHNRKFSLRLQFASHQYNGYREQSAMGRYVLNGDIVVPLTSKTTLAATFFYSDLRYETPGGLTAAQYQTNPRQARPPAGPNRGAVEQKTAVYNHTPYLGLTYERDWNNRWSTRVGVFGSRSDFLNPTIRNYEIRKELNFGARTETSFLLDDSQTSKVTFGAEVQAFSGPLTVFDNEYGEKGAMQTDDDLASQLGLVFLQAEYDLTPTLLITIGGSLNMLNYDFTRKFDFAQPQPSLITRHEKSFKPFFSPRVAVLKKLSAAFSLYANISRGFSPPSLAEVRPSTNAFNSGLNAERGTNYEWGIRSKLLNEKLAVDLAGYDFRLRETIIVQRLPDGADYFVNAGRTSQRGIEALVAYQPLRRSQGTLSDLRIWNSYTYNHYRFVNYVTDNTDYSGNHLTGVPPTVNTSGVDLMLKQALYINATASYVDHVPLNDANDVYANEYLMLGARLGLRKKISERHPLDFFIGVDNALNKKYSLGNDLNAVFGGRYFNVAAPRNYYVGVRITLVP